MHCGEEEHEEGGEGDTCDERRCVDFFNEGEGEGKRARLLVHAEVEQEQVPCEEPAAVETEGVEEREIRAWSFYS